jgi:hypothetical protein
MQQDSDPYNNKTSKFNDICTIAIMVQLYVKLIYTIRGTDEIID